MEPCRNRLLVMPDYSAPEASDGPLLLWPSGGDTAHFEIGPARLPEALTHKTVEEYGSSRRTEDDGLSTVTKKRKCPLNPVFVSRFPRRPLP
jgi:hypothetical protein